MQFKVLWESTIIYAYSFLTPDYYAIQHTMRTVRGLWLQQPHKPEMNKVDHHAGPSSPEMSGPWPIKQQRNTMPEVCTGRAARRPGRKFAGPGRISANIHFLDSRLYFVVSQVCFFQKGPYVWWSLHSGKHGWSHQPPAKSSACESRYAHLVEGTKQFPQLRALARQLFAVPAYPALPARDHSVLQAVQCQRGALHCRLRTSMTSCLYIRIEFNDYFVTVGVIAQLYAILAIYGVLIVFWLWISCFNL